MDDLRQKISDAVPGSGRVGWRNSLRTRLVLMTTISSALLMVLVGLVFYVATRDLLMEGSRSDMRDLARQTTRGLAATLDSVQVSGKALAGNAAGIGGGALSLRTLLHSALEADPAIVGAMLIVEPGKLAPDDPGFTWYVRRGADGGWDEKSVEDLGYDYRVMPWYIRTVTSDAPWWSEPYANEATGGAWFATYNLALRRGGGDVLPDVAIGMVSVDVPLARLEAALGEIPTSRDLRPALLSPERRFVSHPDPALRMQASLDMLVETGGRRDLWPLLQALREGQSIELDHATAVSDGYAPAGERRYTVGMPVSDTGWAFVLSASEAYVLAPLNRILLWVALVGLVAGLLSVSLVRQTSALIAQPIEDLTETARHFGRGDFDFPLRHSERDDEVGVMARAFDSARDSIRQQMEEIADMGAARSKIESELNIAREIQLAMLPSEAEFDAGDTHVEFCGVLEPAKAVGGDFYNLFERDGDAVWFVIGDVSDKGVPAALFMTRTMTVLEVAAQLGGSPGRALHEAAKHLVEGNETCMFATVLCGVIELRTGLLSLASAGHEAPALLRADGHREYLRVPSEGPLGVDVADNYPVWRGRLQPGDTLFTYTDGITEAFDRDNRPFGTERLLAALDPALDAAGQCRHIIAAAREFVGDAAQSDDITVFAVRFKRDPRVRDRFVVKALLEPPLPGDAVRQLIARIDAGLAGHGLPATVMHDVHLVVEEVTSNIINHGHDGGREPALEFQAAVDGQHLEMEFRDDGRPFDPLSQPAPDLDADITDRPIGGLGVHLIRELAEQVAYTRDDDRNVLRVVLHIPTPERSR